MPSHQVIRFQVMAPMSAAATTTWSSSAVGVTTIPDADRLGDRRPGERADEVERSPP